MNAQKPKASDEYTLPFRMSNVEKAMLVEIAQNSGHRNLSSALRQLIRQEAKRQREQAQEATSQH